MCPVCVAVAAGLLVAACSGEKTPKVDAATEQAEAHKRASQGPFSAQVQGYDKAKNLGADVNQKVEDNVKKVDDLK